ncbi:helix-turn-helix domain-containing protein [Eisenbergiella tayi]|uniref:Antitoxin PezA n=1 Tax=Eisenbergiella tayi TaxID=1432052 RepID=A0A1E3A462_9FIRM|nr:helix-turn-helix transcriptional regulator [Eisenbergiella tayi]ODM03171.1 Antitoxin PezA [Eisenbergiella tayi]
MNNRLKELRKTLGITLEEFGKRVGVTRSAVGRIEKGERNLTEQMILSICREFHVNYLWLKEGTGDMFSDTPETIIEELAEEYDLDDMDKKIMEKYLELPREQRQAITKYFRSIFLDE